MERNNNEKNFNIKSHKVFRTGYKTQKEITGEFNLTLKNSKIEKLIVLSCVGTAGRGKSTIASLFIKYLEKLNNELESSSNEFSFEISSGYFDSTKDLWFYGRILKIPNSEMGVMILDCQGNGTLNTEDDDDDAHYVNIYKNLFIAMSTSSIVLFFMDFRYNRDDCSSLAQFQKLFKQIKELVDISFPGIILFRNKSDNLNIEDSKNPKKENKSIISDNGLISEEDRKKYISEFVKNGKLDALSKYMHAMNFKKLPSPIDVNAILNDESYTKNFDYLIETIKNYPKLLKPGLFMDPEALLMQVKNIIEQLNKIPKIDQLKMLEKPLPELIQQLIKNKYITIKNYFKSLFENISKRFLENSPEEIESEITKEQLKSTNIIPEGFESVDSATYFKFKNKLNFFIESKKRSISFNCILHRRISELNNKKVLLENLKKEKVSKMFENSEEQAKYDRELRFRIKEQEHIKNELDIQLRRFESAEQEYKMTEEENKKLKELLNNETDRTQHVYILQKRIDEMKSNVKKLEEDLSRKDENWEKINAELNEKLLDYNLLEEKTKKPKVSKDEEIANLKKELENLEIEVNNVEDENFNKTKKYEKSNDEKLKLTKTLEKLNQVSQNNKEKLISIKKERSELIRENSNLNERLNSRNKHVDSKEAEKIKIEIKTLQSEINSLTKTEQYLEKQLNIKKETVKAYKEEYLENDFKMKELNIRRKELDIDDIKLRCKDDINNYEDLDNKLNEMESVFINSTAEKEYKKLRLESLINGDAKEIKEMIENIDKEKFDQEIKKIKMETKQMRKIPLEKAIDENKNLLELNSKLESELKCLRHSQTEKDLNMKKDEISSIHHEISLIEYDYDIKLNEIKGNLERKTNKFNEFKDKYEKNSLIAVFFRNFLKLFKNTTEQRETQISEYNKKNKNNQLSPLEKKIFTIIYSDICFNLFSNNSLNEYINKLRLTSLFQKVYKGNESTNKFINDYLKKVQEFLKIISNSSKFNYSSFYKEKDNFGLKDTIYQDNKGSFKSLPENQLNNFRNNDCNDYQRPKTSKMFIEPNVDNNYLEINNQDYKYEVNNNPKNYAEDKKEKNNEDEDEIENENFLDCSPFRNDVFSDLSQETFAAFSNKIKFSSLSENSKSDLFSSSSKKSHSDKIYIEILEILKDFKNSDKEIIEKFHQLKDSNGNEITEKSDETPLRLIFEVIKSRPLDHLKLLKEHTCLNKLLTTFYMNTDERFRTNFNNLCGKTFELPFIIQHKDSTLINQEILNTNSNFIFFGFIPWMPITNIDSFYKTKTKLINDLFETNFVSQNNCLLSQFRNYEVTDNDNNLFSFFLMNFNYRIDDTHIYSFINLYDILFIFVELTYFREFMDLYNSSLKDDKNKLFVLVIYTDYDVYDVNDDERMKEERKKSKNFENLIIVCIDDGINDGQQRVNEVLKNEHQNKIYNYIKTNMRSIKESFIMRKDKMKMFLSEIEATIPSNSDQDQKSSKLSKLKKNSQKTNYLEQEPANIFKTINKFIDKFVNNQGVDIKIFKDKIQFKDINNTDVMSNITHNEFFNIAFLKQCFLTKNILNCEVLRNNPNFTGEERDAYTNLIFKLKETSATDQTVSKDIIDFLKYMHNKSEGDFLTKFYLFTSLLKNTFTQNNTYKGIQEQFSFEHLLREIYYSKSIANSNKSSNDEIQDLDNHILSELVHNFQPFEIVDGDSLTFSLNSNDITLGDKFKKNIFVVSIAGPQSTGKSTLNNSIFSVEFQTSQGRCSRGIYGALIPIKENPGFDYMLVLDTEGIDSKENKHDKILTRRLLLFILKVSHIVLLSPGPEMKATFADEFILACNNYANNNSNTRQKPMVTCLFNKVGAHRTDEFNTVKQVWENLLKEKLYIDNEFGTFKEFKLTDIMNFEEPEAIPNAFSDRQLPLLDVCKYHTIGEAFTNKINSIKQKILARLNDNSIQPFTFDQWLNYAKYHWTEISQIKSLNAINRASDVKIKHILNDLLDECKSEIQEISNQTEKIVKEFNSKLTEKDRCSMEQLITKYREFAIKESEKGKEKILRSFEKKIYKRIEDTPNNRVPDNLKLEKKRQIEKMFKLIELDFQLISFREIQKELRYILLIGKSDFHNTLRVEAEKLKDTFKDNKIRDPIDEKFNLFFEEKSYKLLKIFNIIDANKYHTDVFNYVTLKADINFEHDDYSKIFENSQGGKTTCELLLTKLCKERINLLTAIHNFTLNGETYISASKSNKNPYVKILKVLDISNKVTIRKKDVIENIDFNAIENELWKIFEDQGFFQKVGVFFHISKSTITKINTIIETLRNDLENCGFDLSKEFDRIIVNIIESNSEKKIKYNLIITKFSDIDNFMKTSNYIDVTSLPNFKYITNGLRICIQNNKNNVMRIENSLQSNNYDKINNIYVRGLRNYFHSILYEKGTVDIETQINCNYLLLSQDVLDINKIEYDINEKILKIFNVSPEISKNNINDYIHFFNEIDKNPFAIKNVELLIKYEKNITETTIIDSATSTLLLAELDKILKVIRDGYNIYGFEINDYFKFYLLSLLISNSAIISYTNFRLKSLILLNEFQKNKKVMNDEFYCIVSNNYDELNLICVNNIFNKLISQIESAAMDLVLSKYKIEIENKGTNMSSVNNSKNGIETKIKSNQPLTPEENNFYFKILTNPEEIYDNEFNSQWDKLDGEVKEECSKIYSTKTKNYFDYFEIFIKELKKEFMDLDIFKTEMIDIFKIPNQQGLQGKANEYAAKGCYIIIKNFMTNGVLTSDNIIIEDNKNNVTLVFNEDRVPSINPNVYRSVPKEFQEVVKLTFQGEELIYNIPTWIAKLEDLYMERKRSKDMNKDKPLDLSGVKNKMKVKYVECIVACPFCMRKCEESHDSNNRIIHKCSTHQFRIFAGIKLENDMPSFQFCNQIDNASMIKFNGSKKSWLDIKREVLNKQKWDFPDFYYNQQIKDNENLQISVWKLFGNQVCQYYNAKNLNVKYISYDDYLKFKPKSHYIFMLDYSGSMAGSRWSSVKNAFNNVMEVIINDTSSSHTVSVGIFDNAYNIIASAVQPNKQLLAAYGSPRGGTDFGQAFEGIYQMITKNSNNYEELNVLFMTDGEANYPSTSIFKFINSEELMRKTNFHILFYTDSNQTQGVLNQIHDKLKDKAKNIYLSTVFNISELEKKFMEIIHLDI